MGLKHIFLNNNSHGINYSRKSTPRKKINRGDKLEHVNKIQNEYREAINAIIAIKQREEYNLNGYYIDIYSQENFDLQKLESKSKNISLIGIEKKENKLSKATVYIPNGKEEFYSNKIDSYKESIGEDKLKNQEFVENIEHIISSDLESFWTSDIKELPDFEKIWCEMWIRNETADENWNNTISKVRSCLDSLKIKYKEEVISFPERSVFLIYVNKDMLVALIYNCDYLTELRKFYEPNDFFMNLDFSDTRDYCNDLKQRIVLENDSNISVCLLDTGINKNHVLLKDFIKSTSSVLKFAPNSDDLNGHGSQMAGIILYNDLNPLLNNNKKITIKHKIESEKILTNDRNKQNPQELYGYVTEQAVYDTEITNSKMNRTFCMAVTASPSSPLNGKPSSWSSNIDKLIFNKDNENYKRLFVISAGNVNESEYLNQEYPKPNLKHSVEDPGQSWNAITVGAYSNQDIINSFGKNNTDYKNFKPLVAVGDLCPYSSTSINWNKWPIKPEVLFAGGNMCTNGIDIDSCPNLGLLTTSNNGSNFYYIFATSSATAQAAYFISKIYEEYPNIWPETVRGLLVHSSNWTTKMKSTFLKDSSYKSKTVLLRTCGYGIPNLQRALECKKNFVNLIIEDTIQPYILKKKGSDAVYNEMKILDLPWPKTLLASLGSINVRLKITLSYYIEPSPSNRELNSNYNYSSYGLRFDIKRPTETDKAFLGRVDYSMKNEDNSSSSSDSNGLPWFLGKNNQSHGCIHSDFMDITSIKLVNMDKIAIYPVSGWWKTRTSLNRYNRKVRYSLIVSIETPKVNTDLYTAIKTTINTTITI